MFRFVLCRSGAMHSQGATELETRFGAVSLEGPAEETIAMETKLLKPSKASTVEQMRTALAAIGASIKGKKETLYRRWITEYKRAEAGDLNEKHGVDTRGPGVEGQPKQRINYFLCFDVEATCSPGVDFKYPNEIIEFPVVLLHWLVDGDDTPTPGRRRLHTKSTFQRYVKPTWQPHLSEFCVTLTGISQATVDQAKLFPEMLLEFEQWLMEQNLLEDGELRNDAIWVTDGRWDLSDFIAKQLFITPLPAHRAPYPPYLRAPILNIKHGVRDVLEDAVKPSHGQLHTRKRRRGRAQPPKGLTLKDQLEKLGLGAFEGRQHSGIDDATNIARIVAALADMNVQLEPNYTLPAASSKPTFDWMGENGQVIYPVHVPKTPLALAVSAPDEHSHNVMQETDTTKSAQ